MSENCLYLSIWSSSLAPASLTSVILILSSGQEPDSAVEASGVEMAALGGVVVVTAETRHGALGFLAAEDSVVTGPPDVSQREEPGGLTRRTALQTVEAGPEVES